MNAYDAYRRWIHKLWAGKPIAADLVADDFVGHWPDPDVRGPDELESTIEETHEMFDELTFKIDVGPLVEGELVAGRWSGRGKTGDKPTAFVGNDILRFAVGRFVEYWTGSSAG
jgi:SnoaL-like protein